MIGRSDEVGDVVFRAKQAIETLQPVVGRFVAAGVEVVLLLRQDDDGFRRERGQEVFVIEAQRQRPRRALLHVRAELVFHVSPELGDETARRRHGPAIFDAAQPRRHGSAAGVAGDAQVADVHFLARHQVVEGANAVPRAPHPEALVDENLLDAGVVVLAGPRPAHAASSSRPRTASVRPGRSDRRSAPHSPDAPVPGRRIDTSRSPCRCPNVRTRPPHPEAGSSVLSECRDSPTPEIPDGFRRARSRSCRRRARRLSSRAD